MAPHSSNLAWKIPWKGEAWWAAVHGVAKGQTRLNDFTFTFHFHALEKEMSTHSSILAWRIPGMGEPGRLPSLGSHRVGHDWSDLAAAAAAASPKELAKTLNTVFLGNVLSFSSSWAGYFAVCSSYVGPLQSLSSDNHPCLGNFIMISGNSLDIQLLLKKKSLWSSWFST